MKQVLKMSFSNKILLAAVVLLAISVTSCKKALDINPEVTLAKAQTYNNVFDADAAVIGIYGQLMGIAKQYEVLNELRADLMSPTDNADGYLRELSTHTVTSGNPYASPKPFYNIINNCNDVLKNFDIMLAQKKFKQAEYNQRYADIGAIRCWLYLQLGIHFGSVPYVTDPLANVNDIKDASKYPVLAFSDLLDALIAFTNKMPYIDQYPTGNTLVTSIDGYTTPIFFINRRMLLGDLNLWRGNYTTAATYYRTMMEGGSIPTPSTSNAYFTQYKVWQADVIGNNDLAVGYVRFKESDLNSLIENTNQGWRSMFSRAQDNLFNWEWTWVLPFKNNFAPQNPFIDLFYNQAGASYLLKPSQQAMDNWNSQLQSNGFPFDARGNFTYKTLAGQPVIMKFIYTYTNTSDYSPVSVLLKDGLWFLNRAAVTHLHFAEAANRDGRHKLAYALLNKGIGTTYAPPTADTTDVTRFQNTLADAFPYNFDARNGEYPRFRAPWYQNVGIRGRARLVSTIVPAGSDSTLIIENQLADEGALELAYEGHRWPDLLRIALRRNAPSFIADKVYAKLSKDHNPLADRARANLMQSLYLPFKW